MTRESPSMTLAAGLDELLADKCEIRQLSAGAPRNKQRRLFGVVSKALPCCSAQIASALIRYVPAARMSSFI